MNTFLFVVVLTYVIARPSALGDPQSFDPFPYNMDEWHQLQSVANTYRYGMPNTDGSANGTMFHFLFSGFYLIPFMLLKIVDPFALQMDNWFARERIFEVLRLQTMLLGVLSIFVFYKIADLVGVFKKAGDIPIHFHPTWFILSGYFKYDIALMFWMLLSLLSFLHFSKYPTNRNYILAAIPSAIAIAVKVSAAPIFVMYALSYFWFHPSWKNNLKHFLTGIGVFAFSLL